ncbi:12492_t:CDS:2 [Gigaspora margarita]|uniref:12492_t:CDS:1 n=1 Tax=Gigaspora margarita TaxID=4874 RepID=A0ABM8W6R9_GIGMA|nr:12492_t:CDS:2 [Gigaspora margarita]
MSTYGSTYRPPVGQPVDWSTHFCLNYHYLAQVTHSPVGDPVSPMISATLE